MKRQESLLLAGFVIFSVLTSFAFIFYCVGVITGGSASRWLVVFAYVTGGYGLGNIAVLSLAWNTREKWTLEVHKLIALCYLGVFIMAGVKAGFSSGYEIFGILVLALVLWANWLAVKKVVQRDGNAENSAKSTRVKRKS
jgi:hypothetical protein